MRNAFLLYLLVALYGCSTDVLTPCQGTGNSGTLCREYRYLNERAAGYIAYTYEDDTATIAHFYNADNRLIKTVSTQLKDGQTRIQTEQYPQQNSRVQTWHYNQQDSLWKIVHGATDSTVEITYQNGKRWREAYYHAEHLHRYFEYRYFVDDGKLYRIYAYGADSTLLSYRSFDYFSTGQNRVSYYTAQHQLIGRRVYHAPGGQLQSITFTDSAGTPTEQSVFIYNNSAQLLEKTVQKNGNQTKSVFFYN